jgi:hypothetical protein
MEENWQAQQSYEPKPQKHNIAIAMVVAATTFSYLGCFASVSMLQRYELMAPFPPGTDPRPRWFLVSFGSLAALFLGIAGLFRLLSKRHTQAETEGLLDDDLPAKGSPAAKKAAGMAPPAPDATAR